MIPPGALTDPSPRPPSSISAAAPVLIVAAGLAALVGIVLGFIPPLGSGFPPVQSELPDFELVTHAGRPFTRADMRGSVWVADFVFTRCYGACPMMTERMSGLQKEFAGAADVRLLTITVDPDYDKPEVLAEHAKSKGAGSRWVFATGDRDVIGRLGREGFLVNTVEDMGNHSIRLLLVDRRGRARGTYDVVSRPGLEREAAEADLRLLADIEALRREPELSIVLPAVNAALNSIAAVFLSLGLVFIRRRNIAVHRNCMLAAFTASTLFLADYVYYHLAFPHRGFAGVGALRSVYLAILLSHIALAVAVVPLVLTTLILALRGKFETHRKFARVTFPLWLYVSVTGFVIYWMLYRLPAVGATA